MLLAFSTPLSLITYMHERRQRRLGRRGMNIQPHAMGGGVFANTMGEGGVSQKDTDVASRERSNIVSQH